jgi:hypothetical protein
MSTSTLTGLYDYRLLADNFQEEVVDIISYLRKAGQTAAADALEYYSNAFVKNQCYNLLTIRDKAIAQGQQMIAIPVDLPVQQAVAKVARTANGVEATTTVKAPHHEMHVPRPSAPVGVQRLTAQPAEGAAPSVPQRIEFDAFGNPL